MTGTNSEDYAVSYTALPTTDPSWVPTPSTYTTSSGTITYSYIPTSSGFATVTYNTVVTPGGETITYISEPTPSGYTSYEVSSYTGLNSSGDVVTYSDETLSDGSTVSITESSSTTPFGSLVEYISETN